ncbi:MAG TPA: hypothetical protein VGG33_18020 [Polyangia bacterium]
MSNQASTFRNATWIAALLVGWMGCTGTPGKAPGGGAGGRGPVTGSGGLAQGAGGSGGSPGVIRTGGTSGTPNPTGGSSGAGGGAGDGDAGNGEYPMGVDARPDAVPTRPPPGPAGPAVFSETFETVKTDGTWLSACKWNKHTRVTEGCGVGGGKCLRIAQDPDKREPPLFPLPPVNERPPYPAGSTGVCEPYYTNTGTDVVQDVQKLPPAEEYSLNYDVFFEPGYDWARAGKLPGLSARDWDSGCSVEGDGLATDPGPGRWSVRLMWRELGTNELYVYDQDRVPGACGLRAPTSMPFTVGKWIAVTIYVKLNSKADLKDGVASLYLDGQLVRDEAGLRLRATEAKSSLITNIFFSTFYGGNESKRLHCKANPGDPMYCAVPDPKIDVTWVPKHVSYVAFDNIAVYPGLRVRMSPGQ